MSVLETILENKWDEVRRRRLAAPLERLREQVADAPPRRGFRASLERPGMRVIAEIKRVSPAKGMLRQDADAVALAREYEAGGAACISVLTDERFFGGCDADLCDVRAAVSLPVLRKDFLVDEYQVWEARSLGADAVLLIVRALEDAELLGLRVLAERLGMDVLVEVHDERDLERAAGSGARLIGINNRDLETLCVDLSTTFALLPQVPEGATVVSESGITSGADTARLAAQGVWAVLVGEALVRSDNPARLLRDLVEVGAAR